MKKITILIQIGMIFLLISTRCSNLFGEEKKNKQDHLKAQKLSPKELDKLLNRLEKKLGKVKSLHTTFVQKKHLSIFKEVIKSYGEFFFQSPNKVRFEITKPFQSIMITSQKRVAKYERMGGKWKKLKLGNTTLILAVTEEIATWHQGNFRKKSNVYHIQGMMGKKTKIILTPKHKQFQKYIRAIEIEISKDEKAIRKVIIRENGSDFTEIIFLKEKRNISLPKQIFNTSAKTPVLIAKNKKEKK